ncbi:hypothetical protein EI94DRAFT_1827888 [Lactarius quietus]|nr:hypothetical protein EI94DRAFT_1827888 [Lactarius quietus]
MNAAIICNGRELETYDVKQEGTSSLTAFVASEAGKQFKIAYSNNLTFCAIAVFLSVDGRQVKTACLQAGSSGEFLGPYKSECSVLPFKFQELELVDPDLEDAPVVPEMGMIELKAYRCQKLGPTDPSNRIANEGLHLGRVSERSKKAGWHHVAYVSSDKSCFWSLQLLFIDPPSAGEEMLVPPRPNNVLVDYLDPLTSPPHASIKVYYRPRELLRAQGIIPANDVERQGSPIPINNKKRAREDADGSPGPSRSRTKVTPIKGEEPSGDARAQRIQSLQAELDALKTAGPSNTSVKRELRSPSPIVVKHPGEVVDLTLDD